jgi:hypothetical protein
MMQSPDSLSDHVVNYVPLGFMPEGVAREVASQRREDRQPHLDKLAQLDQTQLEGGEIARKAWIEGQLGNETVNSTVFVHVVTPIPVNTFDIQSPITGTPL